MPLDTNQTRRTAPTSLALTAFVVTLGACRGADSTPADTLDAGSDAAGDAGPSTGSDAGPFAEPDAGPDAGPPPPRLNWTRDVEHVDLNFDFEAMRGEATITLGPSPDDGAAFEAGDLDVTEVVDADTGAPLAYRVKDATLAIGVPAADTSLRVTVTYGFQSQTEVGGWLGGDGVTFLWPTYCGYLFPCRSAPSEGATFSLRVEGVPADAVAVYPREIPTEAPTYMPAVAIGAFERIDLGETSAGTRLAVWHGPGEAEDARAGTARLVPAFDFLERTYGPYAYGGEAGTVSAPWAEDATGGMEHHPFWHVGRDDLSNEEVNIHEAAHGWFGNGVRIACWEDFVLSEGTTTYIAGRAAESAGLDLWPEYACFLSFDCDPANDTNTIALLDTCDVIELETHPLWSTVPYMKGAFFYREVAEVLGVATLDGVIAAFYATHVGRAAHMEDMLTALRAAAGDRAGEIDALADAWLRSLECPRDYAELCDAG
jgi:aminopeptidase N